MARPLRVEHAGAVYHILSRGNKGDHIFKETYDKEYFLRVLQNAAEKYGMEIYAYCIMDNHYHLLAGVAVGILSKAMHSIQSTYGSYMQRERKWIGHVFAGRYKSLCVERESYLLELSRYVHLNPVKARIVKIPEEYNWSSYRFYIGLKEKPAWLHMEWLLQEYGKQNKTAGRKYREFVEAGLDTRVPFPAEKIVGQSLLGGREFIDTALETLEGRGGLKDITSKRFLRKQVELEHIYREVCSYYKVSEITRGREGGRSRDMFVYLAKKETTSLNDEIGQKAGGITFSAVAQKYARTNKKLEGDEKARKQWMAEANAIMSRVKG